MKPIKNEPKEIIRDTWLEIYGSSLVLFDGGWMILKRAHILIMGRVQGVFFRSSMKEKADLYGVKGWVKNLPSGEVEALVEGEDTAVDELIDWCWQGPPAAKVDRVEISWEEPKEEFKTFSVLTKT